MLDLGKIRDEIDATDDEIVRLFQHRMALTAEVAQYKIETGKAVFDAERERQKLEKLTGEGTNAFNTKGIQELFQQIMSISRKRQYQLLTENGGEEMTDYTQVDHLPTHGRRVVFQGHMQPDPQMPETVHGHPSLCPETAGAFHAWQHFR